MSRIRYVAAGAGLTLVTSALLVVGSPSAPGAAGARVAPAVAAAVAAAPAKVDPVAAARAHLAGHRAEFALTGTAPDDLRVSSVVPGSAASGLTHVYLQQQVDGIDVENAMVNVAVRADGSVFRVASSAVASAPKLANDAVPAISAVRAAGLAVDALGLQATESFASADRPEGVARSRDLGDGGVAAGPVPAHLVYQVTKSGLRLAWNLGIEQDDSKHWWQIRMDADTGRELARNDWVAYDSYDVYPGEAPSFGGRSIVSNPANGTASPFGWHDTNGAAGAESTLTTGNNANAYTDTDANNAPDAGSQPTGGAGLAFDFPIDLGQAPSTYRPAAVTNLFYWTNRVHDVLYRYGFTEAAGNFQVNNYGKGGSGGDSVNAEAQDGVGVNNANFATPADGSSPRMQMFVWNTAVPDRDGDLDAGVIVHEYGHGVSNRLTGGPANVSCLGNQEQGGEGWSDFYSMLLTQASGTEAPGGRGIGTYALNQDPTGVGIRTQRYSTNFAINDETYDDILTMAVPHGVGEVWATMLNEVTWALIADYGYSSDLTSGNAGNAKALQLVTDGLKLQPCSPGFVDARDAIIAADAADYAGANECLLWKAFAKRGLGFSATQGSSTSKTDGTEAFDLPPVCMAANLTVTATPSPVQSGHKVTYALHVANASGTTANGVSLVSQLGGNSTYVPGSATCGGTFDGGAGTVTFVLGTVVDGTTRDCSYRATVDASPVSSTPVVEDFEPDATGWTMSHGSGSVDWALSAVAAHSPSHAVLATEPGSVSDQYLVSGPIAVPATLGELSFWHSRGFESGFDGGVVEISTNGGGSWADLGAAAFTENGYNSTISSSFSSPIAGRPAFSGSSSGFVRSRASLAAYAGETVNLRFRAASDTTVGGAGWTVDDVTVGSDVSVTNVTTVSATGTPSYDRTVETPVVAPTTTVPTAPTVTASTRVSATSGQVSFTPGSNGGEPVTSFTAQCVSTDGGATGTVSGAASPLTVSGLTTGKTYHCQVLATNDVGPSAFGAFGPTFVVSGAPAAPTVTGSARVSATSGQVSFTPGSNGGAPVTSFTAQCVSTDGGATGTASGAASPLTVSGLTTGKTYHCQVLATNGVGPSAFGAFGPTFVAGDAPAAPTTKVKVVSTKKITATLTPGATNGGAVSSYQVSCVSKNGGKTRTATGTGTTLKVKSLTAGKKYHCRARATNSFGTSADGPWSRTVKMVRPRGRVH